MELREYVRKIIQDVRERGEEALREYARRFDGYEGPLKVSEEEFHKARNEITLKEKRVVERIIQRVQDYHRRQLPRDILFLKNGSLYGLIFKPIRRIGIYVPGGRPLPSSLIMSAVPARLAGVKEIVLATPPKNGKVHPLVLYIAELLGIGDVYKLGGAHAIAAMAYGILLPKVDKIFGPGNKFVNEAKRQVYGDVGIDGLAGPSEIAVIADSSAPPEYVLADLLSQREHGDDSKAWLLTTSRELASFCRVEGVEVHLCTSLQECVKEVNEIAPEHLELMVENPATLLPLIENAGAVYLGPYTSVPSADYFLGVNHVLPTGGAARFSGVLTVLDFLKPMSVAEVSRQEFLDERELGLLMSQIEGMEFHKRSLEVRR